MRILTRRLRVPPRYAPCEPQVEVMDLHGEHVAYDPNSACVVQVSKKQADALKAGVHEFTGLLYSRIKPVERRFTETPVHKIVLNLTHGCNLNCTYCFAKPYADAARMSLHTALDSLNLFREDHDINIAFFGGEPLLNWPVLVAVAERAHTLVAGRRVKIGNGKTRPARASLHVTTNGTRIDPVVAATLKRLNVSLLVSMDGPKDIHNASRPARKGDSFTQTLRGLHCLKNAGYSRGVMCRATFSGNDPRLVDRLNFFDGLRKEGLVNSVSIEPAILSEGCGSREQGGYDLAAMADEWHQAAQWYLAHVKAERNPLRVFFFNKLGRRILDGDWHHNECGAGRGYLTVGPTGNLYACHREEGTEIGTLADGRDERAEPWTRNYLSEHPECANCWARYLCGSGCPQARIAVGGSLDAETPTLCEMRKIIYRETFWILTQLSNDELGRIWP